MSRDEFQKSVRDHLARSVNHEAPFWLDSLAGLRAIPLQAGTYVIDQPFVRGQPRSPLSAGAYPIRVKLVLGDSRHSQPFYSEVKSVVV